MMTGFQYRAIIAVLVIASSVCGCASTPQSRRVAGDSAVALNGYRVQVERFASGQAAINADIERRIRDVNGAAVRLRNDNELRVAALKAADDKRAVALVDQFTLSDFDGVVGQSRVLNGLKPTATVKPVTFDSAKLLAVVKQLNALKEKPDILATFRGAKSYWEALNEAYAKSLAESKTAAASSEAQIDKDTQQLINNP